MCVSEAVLEHWNPNNCRAPLLQYLTNLIQPDHRHKSCIFCLSIGIRHLRNPDPNPDPQPWPWAYCQMFDCEGHHCGPVWCQLGLIVMYFSALMWLYKDLNTSPWPVPPVLTSDQTANEKTIVRSVDNLRPTPDYRVCFLARAFAPLTSRPSRGGRTMLETDYWTWNRLVYGCCRCSLWLLSRSCWHNIDGAVWLVILTAGRRSWTISFQPTKYCSFTSDRKEPDEFCIRAEGVNVALELPAGLFITCLYLFLLLISCCDCCGARSCLSESLSYFV